MKRCYDCGKPIELTKEEAKRVALLSAFKTTNENAIKLKLCVECFHKRISDDTRTEK